MLMIGRLQRRLNGPNAGNKVSYKILAFLISADLVRGSRRRHSGTEWRVSRKICIRQCKGVGSVRR